MMRKRYLVWILLIILLMTGIFGTGMRAEAAIFPEEAEKELLWFGDSRTVLMARTVYRYSPKKGVRPSTILKKHVVARRGAAYGWANGGGYKELAKRLKSNPRRIVIFNFGVNDIGRGKDRRKSYLNLLKKIHKNYPETGLYFMTVNPVRSGSRNPYAKTKEKAAYVNRRIRRFNTYIRDNLPEECGYIDTYSKLKFRYTDGLHYANRTYRDIAVYVIGKKKLAK